MQDPELRGEGYYLIDEGKVERDTNGIEPQSADEIEVGTVLLVRFPGLKGAYRMRVDRRSDVKLWTTMLTDPPGGRKWKLRGTGYGKPATTGQVRMVTAGGGARTLRLTIVSEDL